MLEQIDLFRNRVERLFAERIVVLPHTTGFFADSLPAVYDVNGVRLERGGDPDEVVAEVEEAMERFHHRRLVVDGEDAALAARLGELGWDPSLQLVMARVRPVDRRVDTSMIREVPFDALLEARRPSTLEEPWGTAELADQLDRAKRRLQTTVPTRFLAAEVGGRIAAYCELREHGGVAQIEDVATLAAFRRRGLGRAIVQAALDAAAAHEVVFLDALADDWPAELYAKLGFDVVGTRQLFTRPAHPLTDLRVSTPRLELRIATRAELRELGEVARRGIHPPEEMPFAVAWTDRSEEPGFVDDFVAFHESHLVDWRPDDWSLDLVAFRGGRPIGVQSLVGKRFGGTRTVSTGSWLGAEWQRQGLGTEMRRAVLQLAFEGLGAEAAHSGAMVGNDASLAVSRKLGYTEVGMSSASPRGQPVPHHDLELRHTDFRPSPDVRLENVERLRERAR